MVIYPVSCPFWNIHPHHTISLVSFKRHLAAYKSIISYCIIIKWHNSVNYWAGHTMLHLSCNWQLCNLQHLSFATANALYLSFHTIGACVISNTSPLLLPMLSHLTDAPETPRAPLHYTSTSSPANKRCLVSVLNARY